MMFYKEIAFQDFTIGKVAEEWHIERLQDILILLKNGLSVKQNKERNGYPITRIETISKERIDFERVGYSHDVNEKNLEAYRLVEGDLLFSHINSLEHIGKTALYEGTPEFLLHGMNLLLLRPNKDKISSKYLLYALRLLKTRNLFSSISKKAVNQASINQTELGRLGIPVPPMSEQRAIVGVLGVVDSAIELADQIIAKTERLKKGLMQRLLTHGIGNTEYKNTPIGEIPKSWQTIKLGDVLEICQYGLSVKLSDEGKYPILKMDDIVNGVALHDNAKRVDLDEKTFSKFRLEKGDILFNRTNSYELVGRTGLFLLDGDYTFASYLIRLRPKKDLVDSRFLTFYLIHSNNRLRQLATRAVHQANINATNLRSFTIVLPPLSEQKRFAAILVTLDQKLDFENKVKVKLTRIKQGLMDLLMTGKIRIKVD